MLCTLLPYIKVPDLTLGDHFPMVGPFKLDLVGPLVAIGLLAGRSRCVAFARRKDLDQVVFRSCMGWVLVAGLCISHWVAAFLYFPHEVRQDPSLLLQIWNGLSSVGAIFGAFVGAMIFLRIYCARQPVGRQPVLIYADTSTFGLLIGWCIARTGCSLAHDHPGCIVAEGTFMAVGPWPDGSWRYDLGLLELMFALVLMLVVYFAVRWNEWAPGRLTGLVLTAYAPFRFFLDSLRAYEVTPGVVPVPDERYLGMTPAQWFTFSFLVIGVWLLLRKPTAYDLSYTRESERLEREEAAEMVAAVTLADANDAPGDGRQQRG